MWKKKVSLEQFHEEMHAPKGYRSARGNSADYE
jgi:hypothetical protein